MSLYETIQGLAPQRVFLVQGTEETFATLSGTLLVQTHFPELHNLSRFTVEHAARLLSFTQERTGNDAWYVCYFDVCSSDATQPLLKTLEEPPEGITIVFITPHPYLVPGTIRSRARLLFSQEKHSAIPQELSTPALIKSYIDTTIADEDKDAALRRAYSARLLDIFEYHAGRNPEKLRAVYTAKEMLYRANMPTKQVVEYAFALLW